MKCSQITRLFGAYWDDETTQAEREWVESHLASCASCRREYEEFARTLELAGSLPRVEPAPDLLERVLARARRAAPAPDVVPARTRPWVPVTAAAALAVIAVSLSVPWIGMRSPSGRAPGSGTVAERAPVPVEPLAVGTAPSPATSRTAPGEGSGPDLAAQAVPDSIFDHSEDIEFILDPVRLQRGRATVTRPPAVQGEKAILSF